MSSSFHTGSAPHVKPCPPSRVGPVSSDFLILSCSTLPLRILSPLPHRVFSTLFLALFSHSGSSALRIFCTCPLRLFYSSLGLRWVRPVDSTEATQWRLVHSTRLLHSSVHSSARWRLGALNRLLHSSFHTTFPHDPRGGTTGRVHSWSTGRTWEHRPVHSSVALLVGRSTRRPVHSSLLTSNPRSLIPLT